MILPAWLAGVLTTALVGVLVTVISWAIKSDRARAVESVQVQMEIKQLRDEVAKLGALLERHSPQAVQTEIDALQASQQALQAATHKACADLQVAFEKQLQQMHETNDRALRNLRARVNSHHVVLRDMQVRLAAAGIPETGRTQRLAQSLDEAPPDDG
jgi:ABC-type phosphate transport system auxiliary subunit